MNPKTTLGLAAIAALLAGYIYFFDLRPNNDRRGSARLNKLVAEFDPADITGIEIVQSNQTVRARLSDGHWQLVDPAYPAQPTAVESFLNVFAKLNRQREISAREIIAESGGLSPFGLDPPAALVRLRAGTNLIQLRVGSKTLLGDRVYVQPVGVSGIFTTDAALLQALPASSSAWRDPMLIHRPNLRFDRISITAASAAASRPLKLERDSTNQLWRLVQPIPTRADFGRVEYLIQQLFSSRVSQFVSDNTNDDLEVFGLQTPEAELTLSSGTNPVFQAQFGKSPTNDPAQVYVRLLSHTNVVLVSRELAELVKKPYTDFRDQTLLSFRAALIDRIDARADEAFSLQRQSELDWQIVSPFQAPADRALMDLFLKNLARLAIVRVEKEVVTDFTPYGLAKPTRQYVLRSRVNSAAGPTNQVFVQVDFGVPPTNEFDTVFCRRSDESSVYVVPFADMFRLERAAYALRDRRIWTFAASNVTAVTIQQRGQKRELVRDPVTHQWDKENPVLHAGIEETLHRLGELHADSWSEKGVHQAERLGTTSGKYDLSLQLNEAGTGRRLSLAFGKLASTGQLYASVALEQNEPVIFKFPIELYKLVAEYLSIPSAGAEP